MSAYKRSNSNILYMRRKCFKCLRLHLRAGLLFQQTSDQLRVKVSSECQVFPQVFHSRAAKAIQLSPCWLLLSLIDRAIIQCVFS